MDDEETTLLYTKFVSGQIDADEFIKKIGKLKDCPFCGKDANKQLTNKNGKIVFSGKVNCSNHQCLLFNLDFTFDEWQSRPFEDAYNNLRIKEEKLRQFARETRKFINYIKESDFKKANLQMLVVETYIDEMGI